MKAYNTPKSSIILFYEPSKEFSPHSLVIHFDRIFKFTVLEQETTNLNRKWREKDRHDGWSITYQYNSNSFKFIF